MFSSKSFLNRSLLFCYVCKVKAVTLYTVKDNFTDESPLVSAHKDDNVIYSLLSRNANNSTPTLVGIRKEYRGAVTSIGYCFGISKEKKTELEKFFCFKKSFNLADDFNGDPKYSYYTIEPLCFVQVDEDLTKFLKDHEAIDAKILFDKNKKTESELKLNHFVKNFCKIDIKKSTEIKDYKIVVSYDGNIKNFDNKKKYIDLKEKINKELNDELKKIQKNIDNENFTEKDEFTKKTLVFYDEFSKLVDYSKYQDDFNKICSELKEEYRKKDQDLKNKIAEKQKYLIDTLDCYLKELKDTPKKYSTIETDFNKFVSDEESKYKSLLSGDNLINYSNKKSEITTKINEIKIKINEYNTLKTSIETTINNIINEVIGYSKTETIDNFNTFSALKKTSIDNESKKLEPYKYYVADYNVFFTTLKNNYDTAVNSKKTEIQLDKIKDTNVKNVCDVINKTIYDYIASFDSITDIDNSELKLTETDVENKINNIISTNLDVEIGKIIDKVDKDDIKTNVNAFFTTDRINSYKSNIYSKINNKKDTLKITFTLTVKNTLKLRPEFSTKLETIKNKYSIGVTNSVTFNDLKSEISENRNDIKLFLDNTEVNYSEKITKGANISIEFTESYLIIDKPKDDEHKDDKKDDDPQDNDDKKENQEIGNADTTVSEKKKGCYNRKSNKSSKCSGK